MTKPRPFRLAAPVVAEDDLHVAVARALDLLLMPLLSGRRWASGTSN
jgi:hypothetical protein